MRTLEEFADEAIALPFVEKGRSWNGVDCWGMVYLAYQEVLGLTLPEYTGEYTSTIKRDELRNLLAKKKETEPWSKIINPKPLDGVMLKMLGRSCHVGLMLNATEFLHIEANCGAMIESVNDVAWRGAEYDKVEGFYRHVSQA